MLKIQSDHVIIDGHEPTKEQCETMTLLANALAESDNFKTVEYRDGYAEFEKVGKAEELKFVGAPAEITAIFDSHITKVVSTDLNIEFSTSGENTIAVTDYGTEYLFTVTLETGYVVDTVTLSDANTDYGTLTNKTDTTFTILSGVGGINQTITLTSKQSTSKVSVDLTTLPGWTSLSSGSHNITIVAKADGYRDSVPSAAVSVELIKR